VTELRRTCQPATPEPWPKGAYLLVAVTGRQVHWNGSDWKLKPSPGYAAGETVGASTAQPLSSTEGVSGGDRT